MSWEVYEKSQDRDGVKEWSMFILMKGDQHPNNTVGSFKKGYWFFGKDGGDPAGERSYREGLKKAKDEVERLNRLQRVPSHW